LSTSKGNFIEWSKIRNTVLLLRIPFSFFLSPVYFFALVCCPAPDYSRALQVFVLLHLLVYPASNGYNSFMDQDTESIGGLKHPPKPDKNLFWLTLIMDAIALSWAWILNPVFAIMVLVYILASRAYSWRGIRLKKYAIGGFLTVFVFQGAWTLAMVFCGVNPEFPLLFIPPLPMIISSCLIGAVYPLTQIYQHEQDKNDGVKTLSMLLGFRGTFVFAGLFFFVANTCLFFFLRNLGLIEFYFRFAICNLPVIFFFLGWARKVWIDTNQANFRNTMLMNLISAIFLNISFISMLA